MQKQHLYVIQVNDFLHRMINQIKEHDGLLPTCSFSSVIRYIIHQYHKRLKKMISPLSSFEYSQCFHGKRQNIYLYEEDIQRLIEIKEYYHWDLKDSMGMTIQKIVALYFELIQNEPPQEAFQRLKTPNQLSETQRQRLSKQIHQLRINQGMTLEEWGKKYGVSKVGAWYWEHGGKPKEMILEQMKTQYGEIYY